MDISTIQMHRFTIFVNTRIIFLRSEFGAVCCVTDLYAFNDWYLISVHICVFREDSLT